MFIVLMMGQHPFIDTQMFQQNTGSSGVFSQNNIHLLNYPNGPESDVLQVTYWCWNEVEFRHKINDLNEDAR